MENQIISTQTTGLAARPEIPMEVLRHPGKFPLAPYLPAELVKNLPQIVKAEISQSMLKQSNDEQINIFTAKVLSYFNPKFEDPEIEEELARADILRFAMRCEITEEEFMLALDLATEGKLKTEPDSAGNVENIKLYREIDIIKLGEVKAAYLRFKNDDEKYKNGKAKIKAFLSPPEKKMTPEEYRSLTLDNIRKDYHRFKADGKVLATSVFYDLIKKTGIVKVKIDFLEKFLKNFVPEVAEGKLSSGGTSLPNIVKKDVYVEFQNEMINHYIIHLDLHQKNEEEWIKHWETLLIKI
ncbi:hypothetical protein ACVVIH_12945 [Chryseobacterium arthrosphaerae]